MNQLEVKPFKCGDLKDFTPQVGQNPGLPADWPGLLKRVGRLGPTGSFKYKGRTVAVAGLLADQWGGQAWAVLDARAGSGLLSLTRALRWFLKYFKASQERPITAYLRSDWPQATRWARLLGFHPVSACLDGALALWVLDQENGGGD